MVETTVTNCVSKWTENELPEEAHRQVSGSEFHSCGAEYKKKLLKRCLKVFVMFIA